MGRPATREETFDHVFGSGALQWSWWREADYHEGDETRDTWSVDLTAETGENGEPGKTVTVDHELIMKTARYVLENAGKNLRTPTGVEYPAWSPELESQCAHLVYNADEADLDAPVADELLQLAVLGEVVFG